MSENLLIRQQSGIAIRYQIYRSTMIFLVVFGSMWLLLKLSWVIVYLVDPLASNQARLVTAMLQLLGEPVYQAGRVVGSPLFNLEITPACTGLYQLLVLIAAILSWPATVRQWVWGLVLGSCILMAINLFRIVSIYYTALAIPLLLPFIHAVLWEGLMFILILLIWVYWQQRLR
jgi:exosortase/archaeosortase family protein